MSSIKAEHQIACTAFVLVETKPFGVEDVQRIVYVPDDTAVIPLPLPRVEPYNYRETSIFYLSERGQWVGFTRTSYQERSFGPNEEEYLGPYLVTGQPDLSLEESKQAKGGVIVTRTIEPYYNGHLEMTVQYALELKVPEMGHDFHRDTKIIDKPCPKCLGRVACVYDDLGATDYYDYFAHVCLTDGCDYVESTHEFECNVGGRQNEIEYRCRWCGRELRITG